MKTLNEINGYIKSEKLKIQRKYRQTYHIMPPVGWMNDPNGLVYYKGEYHLFYQFNPYASSPGTMLWGHCISPDLIACRDAGAAIAPETEHTSIFSGGATVSGDKLVAVYTEHYENDGEKREEIYSSFSVDGINFQGRKRLFDNSRLPANISCTDFRDPYPVKYGDMYYVFVGGKDINLNRGIIVVLGGDSLENLSYKFSIGPFYELGDMGECPCWRKVDGKDVILVSGCNVPERDNDFKNVNSSVFIVGNLNFEKGEMQVDYIKEIDKGDCFYAPQLINCAQSSVMIGWQEMWGKPYPTQDMGLGWVGSFSVPRRLSIGADGDILQNPVDELDKYITPYSGTYLPASADINLSFKGDGIAEIMGENGSVVIGCDNGKVYLDTLNANNKNGCIRQTNGSYTECKVRVLLDNSGIEIFVQGGKEAITSRLYIDGNLSLCLSGNVKADSVGKVEV